MARKKQDSVNLINTSLPQCDSMDELVKSTGVNLSRIYQLAVEFQIDLSDMSPPSRKKYIKKKAVKRQVRFKDLSKNNGDPKINNRHKQKNRPKIYDHPMMQLVLAELTKAEDLDDRQIQGLAGSYKVNNNQTPSHYDTLVGLLKDARSGLTQEELMTKYAFTSPRISRLFNESNIESPHRNPIWRQVMESAITKGTAPTSLFKVLECSRQTIQNYIDARPSLKQRFRSSKKKIKAEASEKPKALEQLAQTLYSFAKKRSDKPTRKTLEFYEVSPSSKVPFDVAHSIFTRALSKESSSLKILSDKTSLSFSHIGRMLSYVGIDPPNTRKAVLSEYQIQCISRAHPLELCPADISYYLGIKSGTVQVRLNNIGKRARHQHIRLGNGKFIQVSHKNASLILEANDAGFTPKEIGKYAIASQENIKTILRCKKGVEKKIRRTLSVMFDREYTENPWID